MNVFHGAEESMCAIYVPGHSGSLVSRIVIERELTSHGIPPTRRHPLTLACMPMLARLLIGLVKSWFYELLGQLTYRMPSSAALCLPFRATYALTHIPRDPLLRELAVGGDAGHYQHHQPDNHQGTVSDPTPPPSLASATLAVVRAAWSSRWLGEGLVALPKDAY